MDKPLDRLYLECIADLSDAVAAMKRLTGNRYTRTVEDFELVADTHMRAYDLWLETHQS